jgi:hypothetical protein
MKKLFKNILFAGVFTFFIASPALMVATPQTVHAAPDCEARMLGIPPWYRGLTEADGDDCTIKSPNDVGGISDFIWRIALNVIEMALAITSWVALFFILYGAFLFITGGGNSSQTEKARKSIFNAVIGLIISMGAIAITNLIFTILGNASATNDFGVPEMDAQELLQNGINLAYYVAGIVAVIVLLIAGVTYVTAVGDASRITRAKNMILYSVIGLGLLFAAFAITNFILGRF